MLTCSNQSAGLPISSRSSADDLAVVLLAVGADEVGLAEPALLDDRDDGVVVVVDVDPVADVGAGAVELGLHALEDPVIWRGMNFSTCWRGP